MRFMVLRFDQYISLAIPDRFSYSARTSVSPVTAITVT